MTEAVGRGVQLLRISGDYGKLHEVKKCVAKGSGAFGRVQMCVWWFWGFSAVCGKN